MSEMSPEDIRLNEKIKRVIESSSRINKQDRVLDKLISYLYRELGDLAVTELLNELHEDAE